MAKPARPALIVLILLAAALQVPVSQARKNPARTYYAGTVAEMVRTSQTRARDVTWTEEVGAGRYGRVITRTSTVETYDIRVRYADSIYTGRYSPDFFHRYRPSWSQGDPVEFRLSPGHLILKRPDGRELKTVLVEKIPDASPSQSR